MTGTVVSTPDPRRISMADQDQHKRTRDVGSDSPASKEAAEQTRSGMQGASRGEGEEGGTDRQPAQASGRSGPGPEPSARKGFADENRPSQQGDGAASPERIREESGLHGQKRQSGSGAAEEHHGEDEATVHEA
jgi:hypothetical protein